MIIFIINPNFSAAPVFVTVPTNEDRLQEETAVFRCSAVSEPLYSIRWEKDGIPIAEFLSSEDNLENVYNFARINNTIGTNVTIDDDKYRLDGINGMDFGQLTIFNSMLSDQDVYTCRISNIHGSLNASATLTVQGLLLLFFMHASCLHVYLSRWFIVVPSFPGANSALINASAGEMIVFTCNTEGSPLPNITWYKNGDEVFETGNINISMLTVGSRVISNLTITDATRFDDGDYWCNATNFRFVLFESMSPVTSLTVFCKYKVNDLTIPTVHIQWNLSIVKLLEWRVWVKELSFRDSLVLLLLGTLILKRCPY